MTDLLQAAIDFGWLQWLAVFFNIGYVILAAREHIACWPFGLLGVILLFAIYIDVRLYSDAVLQVFYMGMAVYGWITWTNRSPTGDTLVITSISLQNHFRYILLAALLAVPLGIFWQHFGAAFPFVDALTTSYSILATFLVARKVLENWLYWIIVDAVSIVLYLERDIPLIAGLFGLYTVLAVYGWMSWRRRRKPEPVDEII